ncbi:hypothetical protein EQ852_13870 [Enterococcus hirae]|nr:hypothetical protein EQ852_13870 [Enterococcus hirae]
MLLSKNENYIESDVTDIFDCVSNHIKYIINKNYEFHFSNFHIYSKILKSLKKWNKDLTLSIDKLFEELLIIKNVPGKLQTIKNYKDYLVNFYEYMGVPETKLVDRILTKYAMLPYEEKSFNFIIELIISGSDKFDNIRNEVLKNIIQRIKTEQIKGIKSFPDTIEVATSDLFNLIHQNYFDKYQIISKEVEDKMKGRSPVIDWMLFDVRTDEIIEKLLKIMSFSTLKEVLCTTISDKKIIDNWAIKQFELNKV